MLANTILGNWLSKVPYWCLKSWSRSSLERLLVSLSLVLKITHKTCSEHSICLDNRRLGAYSMFTADFSVTPRNSVIVSLWHNLWSKDKIAEIRLGLSLPADMYVITCYCTLVPDRKQSKGEIFGMHVTWELHSHLLQFLWKLMNLGAKNRRNTTVSWELKFEVNISKMYKEVNFENLLLICYNFRVSILIIKKIPSNKHTFWMTTASSLAGSSWNPGPLSDSYEYVLTCIHWAAVFHLGGSWRIQLQFLTPILITSFDLK